MQRKKQVELIITVTMLVIGHFVPPEALAEVTLQTLSQTEINAYLKGKGMGQAKAAELNQYPGPKHVLALAEALGLSETQQAQSRRIFIEMETQTVALGHKFLEKEAEIENLFASQMAGEEALSVLLREVAEIKAALRFAHLRAHLNQKAVLRPAQIKAYDRLRGHQSGPEEKNEDHRNHH